jgi:serine-type D-Ala-D-Ala carboxypeptidase (penicillin-binding protein 5/6)
VIRAALAAALLVACLVAPSVATAQSGPQLRGAKSAIVIEASTGQAAYKRDAGDRRQIASTTKMMTALVTLQHADLDDVFRASSYRPAPIESQIGLKPGERMSVRDLMRGLLLPSGNDAAMALAVGVAGSERAFVRMMNARARQLGLTHTHYENPIGLDAPGNYSSARDLVRLTLRLRAFEFFRRTVAREQVTLRSGDHPRTLENRNGLVRLPQVNGVKTGHTQQAGYVLVGSGTQHGITLISVVLGAPSVAAREGDTRKLLAWAFKRYRRVRAAAPGEVLARAQIRYRRGAELELVAGSTRRFVVRKGRELKRCGLEAPSEVTGPIRRGQKLGKLKICRGKRKIATLPLVASADVPKAGIGVRTKDWFTRPLTLMLVVLLGLGGSVLLARARRRGAHGRRRSRRDSEPEAA